MPELSYPRISDTVLTGSGNYYYSTYSDFNISTDDDEPFSAFFVVQGWRSVQFLSTTFTDTK